MATRLPPSPSWTLSLRSKFVCGHGPYPRQTPSYTMIHRIQIACSVAVAMAASISFSVARATQPPELAKELEKFQDLKFGFMMHFGAYSQWGCIESWPLVEEDKWARPDDLKPWIERGKDLARFQRDYFALPKTFNPTKFDPLSWAKSAKECGMKYVVYTTKHHDGFCMFDTKLTDYKITSPDCPFHTHPQADTVRAVFDAFRKEGFVIGVYFSKADWHNADYWDPARHAAQPQPELRHGRRAEEVAAFRRFRLWPDRRVDEPLRPGFAAVSRRRPGPSAPAGPPDGSVGGHGPAASAGADHCRPHGGRPLRELSHAGAGSAGQAAAARLGNVHDDGRFLVVQAE